MQYLAIASFTYSALLVFGILFWAWRNSRKRLYVARGMPPALIALYPALSKSDRRKAFFWGIPVLSFMLLFPLGYSIYSRIVLGDDFVSVLLVNIVLLLSYNLADLLVVDWLVICLITPKVFVVPGTEGHAGYKDYAFHLRGAFKGLAFVGAGALIFSAIAELILGIRSLYGV